MSKPAHLDDEGRARMVDVAAKAVTERAAVAEALVTMSAEAAAAMFAGGLPKGDARAVARIAAIMGVKRTPDLVPLCHPIEVTGVDVDVDRHEAGALLVVRVRSAGRTGVEMEAITGAALGAIALYDMIKGIDRGAEIGPVRLVSKTGGSSGEWRR